MSARVKVPVVYVEWPEGEWMAWAKPLTPAQLKKVNDYLAEKYGLKPIKEKP